MGAGEMTSILHSGLSTLANAMLDGLHGAGLIPRMGSAPAPLAGQDASALNAYLADRNRRAQLPAGMRNNNPGNIKFVGQRVPGIVGPSQNTDQGDPQAVFDSPQSGMAAMYHLARRKYDGGKITTNALIAGNGGWTPGNYQAAANVARTMGIGPNDDIGMSDPKKAAQFMHALILQEHGQKGNLYPLSMIESSITGAPAAAPPSGVLALAQRAANLVFGKRAPEVMAAAPPPPQQHFAGSAVMPPATMAGAQDTSLAAAMTPTAMSPLAFGPVFNGSQEQDQQVDPRTLLAQQVIGLPIDIPFDTPRPAPDANPDLGVPSLAEILGVA